MRLVLDTNILISAIIYGGKPRIVHELIINKEHIGFTSPVLLAELSDVLRKKFSYTESAIASIERQIRKYYHMVLPRELIDILRDIADNRVLEAGIEGECDVIISGDIDLLKLGTYRAIKIITPAAFFAFSLKR